MQIGRVVAMAALVFVSAAQADTRAYEKDQLARFERYAGKPVDEFSMFELWQWEVLSRDKLVLWSTIHDAWLVTVDKSCNNMLWAHGLSVTQEMRMKVTAKFDFVLFRDQRCKITEIRPVDYKAMLKDGAEEPPKKE
jgi:hypothetical protein